ncbi:MAG: hypothetical protein QM697_17480 [Lachnospiraceae bacterium]
MKKTAEEIRQLVNRATAEVYEDLTPELIMLIDKTKRRTDIRDGEKSDEIMVDTIGFIKSCTNEIMIEVLTKLFAEEV